MTQHDDLAPASRRDTGRVPQLLLWLLVLASAPLIWLFVTTPMSVSNQALLGLVSVAGLLVANRVAPSSRRVSVWLTLLSVLISSRYLYWRATETLIFGSGLEAVLGYGLFLAEMYAWVILVLGYLQTLWPLERPICALPDDMARWPTVDVYIPTYNESLAVVADTVLAAQNLEYPADKMRIYILDDGRRSAFAAFANEAGVGYIKRPDNKHAKAGNLNHAMGVTNGELICVFDCDHVPTRGFLQSTVGGFLADQRLALLQTPHHFYSPDPFQRNIRASSKTPHEGELFYGPVQKGNDFWNATFFCGSCAVIRRSALEETDGFAVETVTEDAHTALKLQRRGWRTAFLGLPLAAGLATERLSLHIGQRARWARGMTQIMRRDNPLLGRGLSVMQRLCYLNAMLHFQFALPRIVFLTAPLAYLLVGQNIIASSAPMIFAYALPHLVHAIMTNARLTGRFRHAFWGEIYESVLAFHLVKPTLVTLLDPKRGSFNVTDKGGLLPRQFFDASVVRPHLIVAFLLVAGVGWGVVRFVWHEFYAIERDVMLLNLVWAGFSLITLMAAIAVARETRQVRHSVRIDADLPVALYLADGHVLRARTLDISMSGAQVINPLREVLSAPVEAIELTGNAVLDGASVPIPCTMIESGKHGIRLKFDDPGIPARRALVGVVMGRADAWLPDAPAKPDRPLRSFLLVCQTAFSVLLPQRTPSRKRINEAVPVDEDAPSRMFQWASAGAFLALLALLTFLAVRPAFAADVAIIELNESPPDTVLSFSRLGHGQGLTLRGDDVQAGVGFAVPADNVVTDATINLRIRHSARMLRDRSQLQVELNGQVVRTIQLNAPGNGVLTANIPVNPAMIVPGNRINFRLRGRVDERCHRPYDTGIWATISPLSSVSLNTRTLPLANNLAMLPAPFIYPESSARVHVPLMLPTFSDAGMMEAAAMLASWFGAEADYRGVDFSVTSELSFSGHGVVMTTDALTAEGLSTPSGDGVRIAMVENPAGRPHKLLHIHAPDSRGLTEAVRYIALQKDVLRGAVVEVPPVSGQPPRQLRQRSDAPNWTDVSEPLLLGELIDPDALRVRGIFPPLINIPFRTDPSLFLWPGDTVPLRVRYRFPDAEWLDVGASRLDVALNGQPLRSLPVRRPGLLEKVWGRLGGRVRQEEAVVYVPPHLLHGENQLSFYFNMQHRVTDECNAQLPTDALSQILPDSELDISRARQFSPIPDLGGFVAAGFPFTEYADLSRTLLMLPAEPREEELAVALAMMARMGEVTGVAATELALTLGVDHATRRDERHRLVIGALSPAMQGLLQNSGVFRYDGQQLRVNPRGSVDRWHSLLTGDWRQQRYDGDRALTARDDTAGLFAWLDGPDSNHVTMMITANDVTRLPEVIQALRDPATSAKIHDDMALLGGPGEMTSYRVGPRAMHGAMPWPLRLQWAFSERPLVMLGLLSALLLLIALLSASMLQRRARVRLAQQEYEE